MRPLDFPNVVGVRMKVPTAFNTLLVLVASAILANAQYGSLNISPDWKSAYTKAERALSQLSLEDKVNVATARCIGNTFAPLGVRLATNAINVAATFNRTLMRQRGVAMGAEFRGKGVNVALGPMMNLMRAPAAGRNWEGFGGDAYLSGEGAFETITATAKHFVNNEQEHFRTTSSSNVDDRCQHELYTIPFLRSVQAGVAAIMCSYNLINGTYACENDKTLNGILKGELGFQGYWGGTHSTAPAALSGLDMTMPGSPAPGSDSSFFGANLVAAVQNGTVPQSRVDNMALRILAAWSYLVGQDDGYPPVNFDSRDNSAPDDEQVNVQANHKVLIREIGQASTVLLKNVNAALPFENIKTIGVIGNGAGPSSRGPNGYSNRAGDDGVLAMGWGSGTANFPYLITPLDAITARAAQDGSTVFSTLSDTDLAAAATVASGKDVALVFITADSGEGGGLVEGNAGDRNDLQAWHSGDALVQQVAQFSANTIVVVNSVGPIVMEAWIDHPNVSIPISSQGNSVTDILFGAYNPSGRLPYTIGKSINDYAAQVIYTSGGQLEGIFLDYRHFDAAGIAPRFEFGFGLSYTTFAYSHLSIFGTPRGGQAPTGPGSSLDPWLQSPVVTIRFTLRNSGQVAGHEIPQLYISLPASTTSPPRILRGFDSVFLAPGKSCVVSLHLSRFDLSTWDVVSQRWQVPAGKIGVSIGASSRDIRLSGSL
ncbi:glycoside hydrolase family 3 protein [Mycena sp. CBHHK59/15]|nr:glycoside hydrolase family 3 protein [Mycena sp. CBHHK59/15]